MRAQAHHREKRGGEMGTHDVGMIETLEHPHLTPHALLVLLRNGLQCNLARDVPKRRLGGGFRVAAKQSR